MDAARLCGVSPTWMESYDAAPTMPLAEEVLDHDDARVLSAEELPESYDVRDEWGEQCPDLHDITDQGSCGSCWAVSAASTMTDRNCIASNGTWSRYMSSADILSCCGSVPRTREQRSTFAWQTLASGCTSAHSQLSRPGQSSVLILTCRVI